MQKTHLNRRGFLKAVSASTVVLAIGVRPDGALAAGEFAPNPFVTIDTDGVVTVIAKHFEMGQGTTTGLTTLVAEELDADWDSIKVAWAPADAEKYNNLSWGPYQGTGGSSAIANSFMQYRSAGAAARAMLVQAAADDWGVPTGEVEVRSGVLHHAASGKAAPFGAYAAGAAALPVPAEPTLKTPDEFRLIGKVIPRKDSSAKTDGTATFSIDVIRPDMLHVVVARPPRFGATVDSVEDAAALGSRGVIAVRIIPQGVAVYATSTWDAMQARDLLKITWDDSAAEMRGTEQIGADYAALLDEVGSPARQLGTPDEILSRGDTLSLDFTFPFLAHAPMEPLGCVIELTDDGANIWAGSQYTTVEQSVAATVLGVEQSKVNIHTVYAGGSFGRRATPNADYFGEAAEVAKALGEKRPLKLTWTREDDIRGGFYRPMYKQRIEASLDEEGMPLAWRHRIVGQSILKGTAFEPFLVKDGIDLTSVEGAANLAYDIPNIGVELHTTDVRVPVLWWRAVGHTHTAFSTEVMINALAEKAGRDPVEFRLAMMNGHPRHAGVLKLAAKESGWSEPLGPGRGRGIAVHESFLSFVAQVVEVSVQDNGSIKVDKIVCAVDCGLPINPDIIKAQMEGGSIFALGAVMHDQITLTAGEPDQSNFPDYEPIRMSEAPPVEVHIVASTEPPTGVGEPGVPAIGPALAEAIYQATGRRPTHLPMGGGDFSFA